MEIIDQLVENNRAYADRLGSAAELPAHPALQVAVVTCMDARLDVHGLLGLRRGDAHVIRNAGGVVTDDVIRSLTISQRALGTTRTLVIHHTECGMLTLEPVTFKAEIERETGIRPAWAVESFTDLDADVRQCVQRIRTSPFLPRRDQVHGFVYDVRSGRLRAVPDGRGTEPAADGVEARPTGR